MKGFRTLGWSLFMALFPVVTTWLGGIDWVATLKDFGIDEAYILPLAGVIGGLVTGLLRWATTSPIFTKPAE